MPKKILIIYHRNCPDGFGAAWTAWKKFGKKADYLAMEHQTPWPKISGREIYMADFCPSSLPEMKKIVAQNQKTTIIDHHPSQRKCGRLADDYIYDQTRSGAVLAWRYFHPRKAIPKLLLYIEDVDLWKFKLPFTRELIASLESRKFDFYLWNKIVRDFEKAKTRRKYFEEGKAILRDRGQAIERIASYAEKVLFENYEALSVNSPTLVSEIGNVLANKTGTLGIVWRYKKNQLEVSLRSTGKIDVSKIAAKYNGGGLKAAAGFAVKLMNSKIEFPWKKIN
jgi:oligoribonuclease NrnB/cAMP/cGMP phosphodiesterase (DHH superfamily)